MKTKHGSSKNISKRAKTEDSLTHEGAKFEVQTCSSIKTNKDVAQQRGLILLLWLALFHTDSALVGPLAPFSI